MPKTNSFDTFKIPRYMLTVAGAWPTENSSKWYNFKGLFNYSLICVLGVTMLIEAYHDRTDFSKLSEILYILVMVVSYIFKHFSFFMKRKSFIYMIKLLENSLLLSYPEEIDYLMANRVKTLQLLANFYRYLILTCVLLMSISPLFDERSLPFPFPYELGVLLYPMYLFQVITIGLLGWINPCFDSLVVSFMGLAATHLQILTKKIINLQSAFNLNDETIATLQYNLEVHNKLKECVNHHMIIIEFIECVERVFSGTILWQFICSVIIICNTLFHFVLVSFGSSQFFMLCNYLFNVLLQIFMYCWFGNEILFESQFIREACYIFHWYNCNDKIKKYLFVIMERSKRPLQVTVFKFTTLSLSSFTSIIQWSYSYFALLLKMYRKQELN